LNTHVKARTVTLVLSFATLLAASACRSKTEPARAQPVDAAPPVTFALADGESRAVALAVQGKAVQRLFVTRTGTTASGVLVTSEKAPGHRLEGSVRPDGSLGLTEAVAAKTRDAGALDARRGTDVLVLHAKADGTLEWWSEDARGVHSAPGAVTPNAPWPEAETELTVGLDGRLGNSLGVHAQLARDHGALKGFYRYASSREDLILTGTVDEKTGAFTLDEKNAKGVLTGHWKGAFLSPRAAAGTWTSVDGKRSLPLSLEAREGEATLFRGSDGLIIEMRSTHKPLGPHCFAETHFPEVHGLTPPARNAQVNAALRKLLGPGEELPCDFAAGQSDFDVSSDDEVQVEHESGGILALNLSSWSYQGGAHGLGTGHCRLFDTKTLESFELEQVLGSDVLDVLGERIAADVDKYRKENQLEEYDGVPHPSSYCYVDADHIEAAFEVYQIAPYAFGAPRFPYDVKDLVAKMPAGPHRMALFGR
jgi:hypothetical protein